MLKKSFLFFGFVLVFIGHMAVAAPVEYVKVCSLYGADYYYIPGTDICVNSITGDTAEQRLEADGVTTTTWHALSPDAPIQWIPNTAAGCVGGRLLNVGAFSASNFSANYANEYETAPFSLTLGQGDYISSVMMSGGLSLLTTSGTVAITSSAADDVPVGTELVNTTNGAQYLTTQDANFTEAGTVNVTAQAEYSGVPAMSVGTALTLNNGDAYITSVQTLSGFDTSSATTGASTDVCLAFVDSNKNYAPLGCEDANALQGQVGTLSFAPQKSSPPASLVSPFSIVADGRSWKGALLSGTITISACVMNTSANGAACNVAPSADGTSTTLSCGPTSATINNGTNGTNGTNGSNATSCTVVTHTDGTATMTCPDGTSTNIVTKKSGCNSTPGTNGLLVAAAFVIWLARKRSEGPRKFSRR